MAFSGKKCDSCGSFCLEPGWVEDVYPLVFEAGEIPEDYDEDAIVAYKCLQCGKIQLFDKV